MFDFEDIYSTLIGNSAQSYEVSWVPNINTPKSPYALAYQDVLETYERLCNRLGLDTCIAIEDEDVEIIIDSMFAMQRIVALGMFYCGIEYKTRDFKK